MCFNIWLYVCLQRWNPKLTNTDIWCQQDVTSSKKILNFYPIKYVFPPKHFLKILWKSNHFPQKYKKNVSWCFFRNMSVHVWHFTDEEKLRQTFDSQPKTKAVYFLQWKLHGWLHIFKTYHPVRKKNLPYSNHKRFPCRSDPAQPRQTQVE